MSTEQGLRRALIGGMALLAAGTATELLLLGHTEAGPQWVPFGLVVVALAAAAVAVTGPSERSLLALRTACVLLALGGLFGMFEHVEHNYGFAAEIQPEAAPSELVDDALLGSNPLLAPGIFGLMALLGLASTWRQPVSGGESPSSR